jgi:hypothetical protein
MNHQYRERNAIDTNAHVEYGLVASAFEARVVVDGRREQSHAAVIEQHTDVMPRSRLADRTGVDRHHPPVRPEQPTCLRDEQRRLADLLHRDEARVEGGDFGERTVDLGRALREVLDVERREADARIVGLAVARAATRQRERDDTGSERAALQDSSLRMFAMTSA